MKQEEFNEIFRRRTKQHALNIIMLTSPLKYSDALIIIRKQIIRSSTSVGSNFRAVCRARSDKERYSKLCTVAEEADETLYWLELLVEAEFIPKETVINIENEALEIVKVMSSYKKSLELKLDRN